jgi:CubicO group peptidase (beta-lactamase class C family)
MAKGNAVEIGGSVAPGFEAVADAFAANLESNGDVGASVCVYAAGLPVVDLWGGTVDRSSGRPYTSDTLQVVFSTTKGAVAVCANLLVELGLLDLDAPVATYWPEFAAAGKDGITVRWLLAHRAGLPAVDADLRLDEVLAREPVIRALEEQAPAWTPGTTHGYHALTFGWLVGEVVQRVTGRTIGRFFADEVAAPLGLDFWIGLPPEQEARVAPVIPWEDPADPVARAMMEAFLSPSTLTGRTMQGPGLIFQDSDVLNRPDVHAAEIPSCNGVTNARSLARMYGALVAPVGGRRLLGPVTVERARQAESSGPDAVLGIESRYGLGFQLSSPMFLAALPGALGHSGAGGSLGFAHPESGIGFGYVMNQMQLATAGDVRTLTLLDAVAHAVGSGASR